MYSMFANEYYFGGFVGVVRSDLVVGEDIHFAESPFSDGDILSVTITLLSRFDGDNPYFLSTMLSRKNIEFSGNNVLFSSENFLDYFLWFRFKKELEEAYIKGFFRTYRNFENNDARPRGSIDIARHIKHNAGLDNGKIAYSYRENTENNFLNHLILSAYKHINKKYPELTSDGEVGMIISELKAVTGGNEYRPNELIMKNIRPISHPFYTEYENLRKTSIMILNDEGISVFNPVEEYSNGILFYIPYLWELYLEDVIKDGIRKNKELKEKNISVEAQNKIMVFSKKQDRYVQKTYPDFVFYQKNDEELKPFMILDAKFRPVWKNAINKKSRSLGDLDDYDKCIRDMNSINAHATGVVFPVNEFEIPEETVFEHKISEYNQYDVFYTLPVIIPTTEGKTYERWKTEFREKINELFKLRKKGEETSLFEAINNTLLKRETLIKEFEKILEIAPEKGEFVEKIKREVFGI